MSAGNRVLDYCPVGTMRSWGSALPGGGLSTRYFGMFPLRSWKMGKERCGCNRVFIIGELLAPNRGLFD